MTGYIKLCDGSKMALPALLSWRMIHTDGSSSDSFSLSFCYEGSWEEVLRQAVRFEAWDGNVQRFSGIVDEYEVYRDQGGQVACLHGRGLAGLLMDNEVFQREFYWVRLNDILRKYVTPYGITAVEYEKNYWLSAYAVDYGECCWDALSGFCLWAAEVQPRFLSDGTLVISSQQGRTRTLQENNIMKTVWRQTRYGVYSAVVAKYVGTYYEERKENKEFVNMGGCATHRMTIPRRNRCRAGLKSIARTLTDSQKDFRVLEVTVPELFFAQPVDVVQVELKKTGICGTFQVTETENCMDGSGSSCKVTMRQIGE